MTSALYPISHMSSQVPSPADAPPASPPLRLAVVGCGAVTERYHLPALLASPLVQIAGFIDPVVGRAEALASRGGGAFATDDHRQLPGDVDLALVAVPNAWHEPVAVDLLRAGVHVLVEKPMARTVAECDRMLAAAAAGRATLAVGHDFRFFPVAQAARALLAARPLGAIRHVDVRQGAGTRWPCLTPGALLPESGGGVVISFGVHTLDLLLWWLGDLEVIEYRDDSAGGVEAECECEMRLANGVPLHLEFSRRRALRDTLIAECERGTIEIGIYEPAIIRLSLAAGGPPIDGAVADPDFDHAPLVTVFGRQLADLVDAIRSGRPPLVGGAEGRRAVALAEACYAARTPLRRSWDYPEAYAVVPQVVLR